jgi:hypothetical protein
MIKLSVNATGKGWFVGPWNSSVPIAVGCRSRDERPSYPSSNHEIYLVARGQSKAAVGTATYTLGPGDMLVVEPGETHTFVESSPDYLHFVIQAIRAGRQNGRNPALNVGPDMSNKSSTEEVLNSYVDLVFAFRSVHIGVELSR